MRIKKHPGLNRNPLNSRGHDPGVVRADKDKLTVVDPRATDNDPISKATRSYNVTRALPGYASQADLYSAMGHGAVEWVWDGFNATVSPGTDILG
jgi:hypothetical protein